MWPFKKKKKKSEIIQIKKPDNLIESEIIVEKYSEGVDYHKYRVELHINNKKGISKDQLEDLLVYNYKIYYQKLIGPLSKLVAISVFANQDRQTKIVSIIGRDSNPKIEFAFQAENYLNDKPSFKHGLSYTERQNIFLKADDKYMLAMYETDSLYESYVFPKEKEAYMKLLNEKNDYREQLEKKYLLEVANKSKIDLELLNNIYMEGTISGWPKSKINGI